MNCCFERGSVEALHTVVFRSKHRTEQYNGALWSFVKDRLRALTPLLALMPGPTLEVRTPFTLTDSFLLHLCYFPPTRGPDKGGDKSDSVLACLSLTVAAAGVNAVKVVSPVEWDTDHITVIHTVVKTFHNTGVAREALIWPTYKYRNWNLWAKRWSLMTLKCH